MFRVYYVYVYVYMQLYYEYTTHLLQSIMFDEE